MVSKCIVNMIQMINVIYVLITMKSYWYMVQGKTLKLSSVKKAIQKSHPDHIHPVYFKSMKTFNMRENPRDGSRKGKLH